MANVTTATMRRTRSSFGRLQIAITVLVGVTALVHLFLGVNMTMVLMGSPVDRAANGGTTTVAILAFLFLSNFGSYIVLATALYLPVLRRFQPITRVLLIGDAALTIVAYFMTHLMIHMAHASAVDPIGLVDKAVEVALIVLLVIDGRSDHA